MAVSEVTICNKALGMLGATRITSLSDATKNAGLCQENYEIIRDAVLEDAPWSFALVRAQLPADVTAPLFGWGKSFTLPSAALVVWEFNEERDDYIVEGGKILTNASTCNVIYGSKVTDPSKFSALYVVALAARLAAEIAMPITHSKANVDSMMLLYDDALKRALKSDGRQGKAKSIKSSKLVNPRFRNSIGQSMGPDV